MDKDRQVSGVWFLVSGVRGQEIVKSEVGPVVVPNERDYAAAKDAEVGNWNRCALSLKPQECSMRSMRAE